MSRMRRLKREKIKATVSGLVLMIAIGVVGGVGSYAYFTDQADAKNDLVVTMGNLDIDIPRESIGSHEIGKERQSQYIYIDNNGTLNQNVYLNINNFKVDNKVNEDVLKDIKYQIEFKYVQSINGEGVELDKIIRLDSIDLSDGISKGRTLNELNGKRGYLKDEKGELITLSPQDYIKCTLTTDIFSSDKKLIQNKIITFDTLAEGIQLGGVK